RGHVPVQGERGGRRPHRLRRQPARAVPARRRLRAPNPAGRQACRPAGRAADQVRSGDQSQDCPRAWSRPAAAACRAGRRGDRMKWRELILAFGAAAVMLAPLPLSAQSSSKVWRIGVLETTSMALNAPNFVAFRQSLRDRGYVEGQNLAIEYRSAEGRG